MFGLTMPQMLIGLALLFLAELAVFWAATSLGDVAPMNWGKLLLVVLVVSALAAGLITGLVSFAGASTLLNPDNYPLAFAVGAGALFTLWLVPAVLYAPLLSVSFRRSFGISIVQWLLRKFLYVLILAVVMVVLACIQIIKSSRATPPAAGSGLNSPVARM